ncbi:MAG: SDR family oxidoreductase [Candidatus Accumulibacter phosphatis]|uniref:3-oxoacyl-[acyl-carrier-protein] reductase FabG n=2 Tax=Candidatus Accumulibacter TaxID=327159 RepID=A0A080MJP2_9PROT|nr:MULTISPECIES: SDR family oxidoreductase [Candidatus Accumulibacter]KFB77529.1 MAG: 3-oxoacyl-[acyl-carrier-protein] reductase FabG [Candidatus Accumulibacter cognatus]MBN8518792.1 SDR family oxidoreductase [Accumulibacter sp.]MBO3711981.1 SDR family oxidoreductase [Accumulibacter sp.]MCC2866757.1 SDR family oxidoreductase [Candidatus Accumulibacter phosphatis]MCM8578984.1 SDR family oxidoreductase [Accumulibacter sp.]
MQLENARILLTGASGGLGQELAQQLTDAGAALLLAGRDSGRLGSLVASLGPGAASICADLGRPDGIAALAGAAREFDINVLINNAGIGAFGLFEHQDWATIEQVLATNLEAPIHLTQALLPWLKAQPQAAIVNIGSTFGSLPFPGFAAYSAAKAGLRGFSQALRRELADSLVAVIHLAPRAIDTPLNSDAVKALNRALKNHSDSAEEVARQVVRALRRGHGEHHFGFPERLFAWLNGVAPSLIDRGLAGKLAIIKQHGSSS